MTYGDLKKRVYFLLDIKETDTYMEESLAASGLAALPAPLNAIMRKAALYLHAIYRMADFRFEKDENGVYTTLPNDVALVREIVCGGRVFGAEAFETVGGKLFFLGGKEGIYSVGYYAYPTAIGSNTSEETELALNEFLADTVAYGAAAERCHSLYPTDMKRYIRLATEFDERLASAFPRAGERKISNTFFGKRRGEDF